MAATPDTPDLSSTQAGLWLTLAHAFLPPMTPAVAEAFRSVLADDLRELAAGAGIGPAPEIADFQTALIAVTDAPALLAHYSELFLVPPPKVCLNLGFQVDGTLHGPSQDRVAALLARRGLQRRAAFHDLPDHLSALLEVMACLDAEPDADADREMLRHELLLPGLAGVARELARHAPGSPYLALARFAQHALETQAAAAGPGRSAVVNAAHEEDDWRTCRHCGAPYARERDLVALRRALTAQGLPVECLEICSVCRSRATVAPGSAPFALSVATNIAEP